MLTMWMADNRGKKCEVATWQCIANMIKFCTNLTVMAQSNGNVIDKTKVFGITANYFEQTGNVISLEMNFVNESCSIIYSDERLPLELQFVLHYSILLGNVS